jgi:hypothetical protein
MTTESWDWVSAPVICGTAAGGFTSDFVRPIAKLITNWSDTPNALATAPSSEAHSYAANGM